MITMLLRGGLGNQMFQYACGRALALRNSTTLSLNPSVLGQASAPRKYQLDCFNLCDLENEHQTSPVIKEKHYHFDPAILSTKQGLLDGYWQSEQYFKDYADIIRQDFTFHNKVTDDRITNSESVSIQVRRGDYVNNPNTSRFHGNLTLDYYRRCVLYIKSKIRNPQFFLFSDEPEWFAENFPYPGTVIWDTDENGLNLLSQCKHHINANSSYSWWGSWLNTNPNKIVCVPQRWFNNTGPNTKDLIPEGWIRINN